MVFLYICLYIFQYSLFDSVYFIDQCFFVFSDIFSSFVFCNWFNCTIISLLDWHFFFTVNWELRVHPLKKKNEIYEGIEYCPNGNGRDRIKIKPFGQFFINNSDSLNRKKNNRSSITYTCIFYKDKFKVYVLYII